MSKKNQRSLAKSSAEDFATDSQISGNKSINEESSSSFYSNAAENVAVLAQNDGVENPKDKALFFERLKNFGVKIVNWSTLNWSYIIAVFFILTVFTCILIYFNVYPFGAKTMANYDLLAQICPFIEHFFDVFSGKSSLFYTTAIAGGADIFGTLAYCTISPFTWIFLLFGKGNVYYGVSIVMPLKLIAVSFSAIYFIKRKFTNISELATLVMSLLYAYCGYTFVANTYINWVDFLIYMPFVALGYEKLVKSGNIWQFAVSYALMIYTCFSISCFALLIIFIALISYGLFAESEERQEIITKTCLALLVTVGLALPLLVPSFISYTKSGRNTGLFENVLNELNADHLYKKTTYIVSDTLFLVLTLVYFIKNGVKRHIDKFLLLSGVLITMPVLIDECCNLLNAGSYMSYSLRFGFLNAFYTFYVAGRLLNGVEENGPQKSKNVISTVCFSLLSAIGAGFMIYLNLKVMNDPENDFSSIFAHSLGGLEVVAQFAAVILVLTLLAILLYKKNICKLKNLTCVLAVVLATQAILYNTHLVGGNLFTPLRYDQYNQIVEAINQNGDDENDYYRIKDTADSLTACSPFPTHTNSFSVFSSVIDQKNFTAPEFFNYKGNGVNVMKSANGLFLGDMIMGYKYYYHHHDKGALKSNNSMIERPYIEMLDYAQMENFTGFVNKAVFPNAYTVKSGELDFSSGTYAEKIQKLYKFLGGAGEAFNTYDFENRHVIDQGEGVYTVKVVLRNVGHWFVEFDFPEEYDVYYCKYTQDFDEDSKVKADDTVNLSYYRDSGGSYSVTLKNYSDAPFTADVIKQYCKVKCLAVSNIYNPDDNDEELYDVAWKNKVDYKIKNGNAFVSTINADDNETYLFMNYVAIDGFKATVNGKDAELIDNGLDFILVKLEKGRNTVEIKYSSPYIKYGIFGLIGGLLLIFLVVLILKKGSFYKKLKPVIFVAAIVLALGIFAFFFAYPTSLFLTKLIKLLISLF